MNKQKYSYSALQRGLPLRTIRLERITKRGEYYPVMVMDFIEPKLDMLWPDISRLFRSVGICLEEVSARMLEVSGHDEVVVFNSEFHNNFVDIYSASLITVLDKDDQSMEVYGRKNIHFDSIAYFMKGVLGKKHRGITKMRCRKPCAEDNRLKVFDVVCTDGYACSIACYSTNL